LLGIGDGEEFDMQALKETLRQNGGEVLDWPVSVIRRKPGTEILLLSNASGSNPPYLFAVASGIQCVYYKWIEASLNEVNSLRDENETTC
jgi:hypothetical protein